MLSLHCIALAFQANQPQCLLIHILHQLQCGPSNGDLFSCSWANVDLTVGVCCVTGWCQNWASGSGRSGSGFLWAWAGPTWRIGKAGCTLKLGTCGWRYPLHCCSSSFGKSLRGQCVCFYTVLIKLPHLEWIQSRVFFSVLFTQFTPSLTVLNIP